MHEEGIVRTVVFEEMRYNEDLNLSGTVDRVIEFEWEENTIRAVTDYKSIKDRYFKELTIPKWDHAMQQHAYELLKHEADYWIMLYENKDTHELKIYALEYSTKMLTQLAANMVVGERWIDEFFQGEIKTKLPLVTTWCTWCEWNQVCLQVRPDRANVESADKGGVE